MERMIEDLQASYISILPPNSFGAPVEYTQFIGEENQINGNDADSVIFFTRIPQMFSAGEDTVSGLLVKYEVVEDSENGELTLLRHTQHHRCRVPVSYFLGTRTLNRIEFPEGKVYWWWPGQPD